MKTISFLSLLLRRKNSPPALFLLAYNTRLSSPPDHTLSFSLFPCSGSLFTFLLSPDICQAWFFHPILSMFSSFIPLHSLLSSESSVVLYSRFTHTLTAMRNKHVKRNGRRERAIWPTCPKQPQSPWASWVRGKTTCRRPSNPFLCLF